METILHAGRMLVLIYRGEDWPKGLKFITPQELFLQVGSWYYSSGTKLASHAHKHYERTASKTQEMTYIRKGSMKVFVYAPDRSPVAEFVLREGDTAVFADGGHGYEILEEGTQVLEAKNGPFVSVEQDKEKFS